MSALLSLCDDVLIHICLFLPAVDRISLSKTCLRFNQILSENTLVRRLNFSYARQLTVTDLKSYFRPQSRCENVASIDLSSCYWLPSAEMYQCLKKMRNLTNLNVIDTRLSDIHLSQLMDDLPQLSHLSCSNTVGRGSSKIEYLYIEEGFVRLRSWWKMIKCCPNLRELWIKCAGHLGGAPYFIADDENVKFPFLHTFAVHVNYATSDAEDICILSITCFINLILTARTENCNWKVYWLDTKLPLTEVRMVNKDPLQMTAFLPPYGSEFQDLPLDRMNLSYMGNLGDAFDSPFNSLLHEIEHLELSHLYLPRSLGDALTLPSTLKHLDIAGCWSWDKLRTSSTLENLQRLSLPFCLFINSDRRVQGIDAISEPFLINKKVSRISTDPWPYSCLTMFVKMCPNLQHLRLVNCSSKPGCLFACRYSPSLGEICSWKNLRTLQLECLKLPVGNILIKIAQACPLMESVNIVNLQSFSEPTSYIVHLKKALQYWKNLKHLSLREEVLILLPELLDALQQHCPGLERLVLISPGETSPLTANTCLSLIESFPSMVMLYISLSRITELTALTFNDEVGERYKKSRPALWAKLDKYCLPINVDNGEAIDCPLIHHKDMITHVSPFTIFPDCKC